MREIAEQEGTNEQMVKPLLSNIPLANQTSTDILVPEPVPKFSAPQPVSKVPVSSISAVELNTNGNSPVSVSLVTKTLKTSPQQEQPRQSLHQSWENDKSSSLPLVAEELSLSTEVKQTLQQLEQERLNRECDLSRESQQKQVNALSLPDGSLHHVRLQLMATQAALEARIAQQRSFYAAMKRREVSECMCVHFTKIACLVHYMQAVI